MKVIHFLDLESYAVRGPLERGKRYVRVHTQRRSTHNGTYNEPFAYESLSLTGTVIRSYAQTHPGLNTGQHEPHPMTCFWVAAKWSKSGFYKDWHFASDAGQWDVPGISYRNRSNYILDVTALLREGIRIDGNR